MSKQTLRGKKKRGKSPFLPLLEYPIGTNGGSRNKKINIPEQERPKSFFFFCVNKFAFCLTAVNRRTSSTDAFSNPRPSLIFCCAHISSAEQEEERETECIKETALEKGLSILAKIAVGLSSDHSQKEEKVRENESLLFIVNVLCHCRHSPVSFEH